MNNTLKIINTSLNEINDYGHNFNTIQLTKSQHEEISQALQEKAERDNPTLLTLKDLRQMDGEPVWIETAQEWRMVYTDHEDRLIRLYTIFNTMSAQQVFNNDGRIYRHKPKKSEGEADER